MAAHCCRSRACDIDARFTAVDAWSPIPAPGWARKSRCLGFGVHAWLPIGGRLGLDIDSRRENGRSYTEGVRELVGRVLISR